MMLAHYAKICITVEGIEDSSGHFSTVNEPQKKAIAIMNLSFIQWSICTDHIAYCGSMKNTYVYFLKVLSGSDVQKNGDYTQRIADRSCDHWMNGHCCLNGSSVVFFIFVDKHSLSAQH